MNKKKLLALLMALVMTFSLVPVTAMAEDATDATITNVAENLTEKKVNFDFNLSAADTTSRYNLKVTVDKDIMNGLTFYISGFETTVSGVSFTAQESQNLLSGIVTEIKNPYNPTENQTVPNGFDRATLNLLLHSDSFTCGVLYDTTAVPAGTTMTVQMVKSTDDGTTWEPVGSSVSCALNPVAKIGNKGYATLEDAFTAAVDGDTITLLRSCDGNGIVVPQGKFTTGLTVDFGGNTYTVSGNPVGSKGTETIGFQLLKDNNITFENGTIYADSTTNENLQRLVQNYSNLTLDGMTLNMTGAYYDQLTISNCNGEITINNSTVKAPDFSWLGYLPAQAALSKKEGGVGAQAMAVGTFSTYPSVGVTVTGTSVINGNVKVACTNNGQAELNLNGGTLNGNLVMGTNVETATITKSATFNAAAPTGYKWENNGTTLAKITGVAAIGEQGFSTLAEAVDAEQSAPITLLSDIALSEPVIITKNLTINLNGHNITANNARALWVKSGDVTITGTGTISSTHTEDNTTFKSDSSVIRVGDKDANGNKAKLTIGEGVTVSTGFCYGITAFGINDSDNDKTTSDIELVVNGKVNVTGSQAAISGNGTSTLSATTMNINGSVSATQDYAIYHPGKGTLTVNGTVTGKGGIEMKGGRANINSGAFVTATASEQGHSAYNNGASTSGYAIAAVSNPNYVGDPAVTIEDGATISGKAVILADFTAQNVGTVTAKSSSSILTDPDYKWVETTAGVYKLVEKDYVAQIDTTKYETLAEAFAAAQNGDTITLQKNVSLTERLFVNAGVTPVLSNDGRYATTSEDKSITLNLNGKNITSSSNIALAGGSLNITGSGIIESTGSGLAPVEIRGTGDLATKRTLTIGQNVTLKGGEYGLNVFGSNDQNGDANSIEVNINGTIQGCVFVLGNLINESNNITVNVNSGAKVTTEGGGFNQAIANNGYATVNINSGATVIGKSTGIETRAGTLNIFEGATVTGQGSGATASTPNGNGCTTINAGVAVAQHTTKKPTTLNISGGTITGTTALYISNPQDNEEMNMTVNVTGGQFNGSVASTSYSGAVVNSDARIENFISGGTFNSCPAEAYLAKNYIAKENGDGTWTVELNDKIDYEHPTVRWRVIDEKMTAIFTYTSPAGTSEEVFAEALKGTSQGQVTYTATDYHGNTVTKTEQETYEVVADVPGGGTHYQWGQVCTLTATGAKDWFIVKDNQEIPVASCTMSYTFAVTENVVVHAVTSSDSVQRPIVAAEITSTESGKAQFHARWTVPSGCTIKSVTIYRGYTTNDVVVTADKLIQYGTPFVADLNVLNGDYLLKMNNLTPGKYQHAVIVIEYSDGTSTTSTTPEPLVSQPQSVLVK